MNFIETLSHNMVVAYQRKDGTFSFWRLDKTSLQKSGAMRCESLSPDGQAGFPVSDYRKIYPVPVLPGKIYYSAETNSKKMKFLWFKFPSRQSGQDKTQVVLEDVTARSGNNNRLTLDYQHFADTFVREGNVLCEL